MSDHPNQESAPQEENSASQEAELIESTPPTQEAFGSFPETSNAAPSPFDYDNPVLYANPAPYSDPPVYSYGYSIPPQAGYGPPPAIYRIPPAMQPASPLPLWTAIRQLPRQYWRVLTQPNAVTFIEEQGKAAWNIIWAQLLLLGVVEAVFILLLGLLEFFIFQAFLPSNAMSMFSLALPILAIVLALFVIVSIPISFFFGAGILHLVAKAFGGQSTFLSYCYSYALILMPISILSMAFSIIPCIGSVAGLAGVVYEFVLLIFMTMGVHRLRGGKASATVLIPVATGAILFTGIYIAYYFWILSIMPHN